MSASNFSVEGNVVDIRGSPHLSGRGSRSRGGGSPLSSRSPAQPATYLLPGFIDAHVHVESSMLVPSEFARAAVVHGTVATVSDPHEIGNVLGVAGVRYMLDNAAQVPFKFYFGAPSCVPATTFETAGAAITVAEVEELLDDPRIRYLSEMMNFPGMLHGDPACLAKVQAAHDRGKPVDGHAPGLRGAEAARYIAAGITTDHECFTKEEALDKLAAGCKISIREGSAARNFDALYTLLGEYPGQTMLCSDDKHPDELLVGHINLLVRRAVERGIDVFDALQAACIVPVEHYGLDVGQLRVGDPADFIEVDSLTDFNVLRTWIDGQLVAETGQDDDSARRAAGGEQVCCRQDQRSADIAVAAPNQACQTAGDRSPRRAADHQPAGVPAASRRRTGRQRRRPRHAEDGGREPLRTKRRRPWRSSRTLACSAGRWPRAWPTIRTM